MRECRRECIISITPISGRISASPVAPYAASKFALEALSEALAQEARMFNVRMVIVGPGIDSDSPIGPDAQPFIDWRASMTEEQWIDWAAADDDAWYEGIQRDFGLDARSPTTRWFGTAAPTRGRLPTAA